MRAVIAVNELLARSRLVEAARSAGYEVTVAHQVPRPADTPPDVLVVDLDHPGTIEALELWRAAHPEARVVGFAFHVNQPLLARAKALGIEIMSHGATTRAGRVFS